MQFIDKKVHLIEFFCIYLAIKIDQNMDKYFITIGTYLILMLFIKVYYAVAVKE